jgi:HEPN domain-containing protein
MNRKDLQALSELRLKEAKALFSAGFPEGAYYLAGYAVECALKACIAKRTQEHDFPDKKLVDKSYTHDLERLIDAAELSNSFKKDKTGDSILELKWEHVRRWSEQSRYELLAGSEQERRDAAWLMIISVESVEGGVLPWIRQFW